MYGGSMLNHLWLVCVRTLRWPDAPLALDRDWR